MTSPIWLLFQFLLAILGAEQFGLEMIQESNGIPGREQEKGARQRVLVTEDRLRLEDQATGIHYIFRLDTVPSQVWEVTADGKKYRDGVTSQVQADRDRAERQTLERLKAGDPVELDTYLRENYVRRDGTRQVEVQAHADAPQELLGYKVKRYLVRENGRVVVDVLVTEDLGVEIPFFDFYRRVGAFSEEVLAKLKEIRGVPLEARITVVTASLSYPIEAKVTKLVKRGIAESMFELPEGATPIVESPFAPCEICGVDVEKKSPPSKIIEPGSGLVHFFCGYEHRTEWVRGLQRKPK